MEAVAAATTTTMIPGAPPPVKKQRLEATRPVVSVDSAAAAPAPAEPVLRVGRTRAVRFHKAGRCWRVGRLVQVLPAPSAAAPTPTPQPQPQYCLRFADGATERLSARHLRRAVRLARVGVGTRVAVRWRGSGSGATAPGEQPPRQGPFHAATVTRLRAESREGWNVVYDFGEREWINLGRAEFHILSQPEGHDDDDDEEEEEEDDGAMVVEDASTLPSEGHSWTEEDDKVQQTSDTEASSEPVVPTKPGQLGHGSAHHGAKRVHEKATVKPKVEPGPGTRHNRSPDLDPEEAHLEWWGVPDDVRDVEKGCRIALWWPGARYAVSGTMSAQRKEMCRLDYSRAHNEWVDLRKYRFKILRRADGTKVHTSQRRDEMDTLQEPRGDTNVDNIFVGSTLAIYWASEGAFRDCTVIDRKSDGRTKPYWLDYGNGEREWVNFDNIIWRLRSENGHSGNKPQAVRPEEHKNTPKQRSHGTKQNVVAPSLAQLEASGPLPEQTVSLETGLIGSAKIGRTASERVSVSPEVEGAEHASLNNSHGEDKKLLKTFATELPKHKSSSKSQHVRDHVTKEKLSATKEIQPSMRTDAVEEMVVGSKIKIWDDFSNSWENAMVIDIRLGFGAQTHQVEYENGDKKWVDCAGLVFRFLRGSKRRTEESIESSDDADVPEQEDNEWEILPGSQIRVWDPSKKRHFQAKVIRYCRDGRDAPYFIELENGNREWIGFENRSFRFCPGSKRCHSPFRKTKLYAFPEVKVGTRLRVWWENEQHWYAATITKLKPERERPHFLEYDDGDTEWHDLARLRFMVCTAEPDGKRKGSSNKKKAKRKRSQSEDGFDSESGLEDDDESLASNDAKPDRRANAETVKRTKAVVDKSNGSDSKSKKPEKSLGAKTNKKGASASEGHEKDIIARIQVGSRVSVWWDGEDAYFPGTITHIREAAKRPFCLEYDDGDREWIDLQKERFRLLRK